MDSVQNSLPRNSVYNFHQGTDLFTKMRYAEIMPENGGNGRFNYNVFGVNL